MGVKRSRMSPLSRGLVLVGAALLVISVYFPWWGMRLIATMYPEGLDLLVYPYKLEGHLDTINILNHYIGMKEIHEEDFPEFQYIPYVIWGIAIGFAVAAAAGSKRLGYVMIGLLAIGGISGYTTCIIGCILSARNWIPGRRYKSIPLYRRWWGKINWPILRPIPVLKGDSIF